MCEKYDIRQTNDYQSCEQPLTEFSILPCQKQVIVECQSCVGRWTVTSARDPTR